MDKRKVAAELLKLARALMAKKSAKQVVAGKGHDAARKLLSATDANYAVALYALSDIAMEESQSRMYENDSHAVEQLRKTYKAIHKCAQEVTRYEL